MLGCVLAAAACLPLLSDPAWSDRVPPDVLAPMVAAGRVGPQVIEALQRSPQVQVVIAFAVPESEASSVATPDHRAAIQRTGDTILRRVGSEFRLERRFGSVNAMSGEITAGGLLRLGELSEVVRVDLVEKVWPNLAQSVPLAKLDFVKSAGWTGDGSVVAMLDSGIDSDHPGLGGSLVAERCFCRAGGGCCPGGGSDLSGLGSAEDDNGHGTQIAGVLIADGVQGSAAGGATDAGIVAVKVTGSDGSGDTADVLAGLNWILEGEQPGGSACPGTACTAGFTCVSGMCRLTRVDVVNIGLGFGSFQGDCDSANANTMALASAVGTLRSRGTLTVAGSGNGKSSTAMEAPACLAAVISVGATWDANLGSQSLRGCTEDALEGQPTCWSNSDAKTDLFAPGAIVSTTQFGGGGADQSGTSAAAGLVSACIADLREARPGASADQIEAALKGSPTHVTDPKNGLSFPRLDCVAALGAVAPTPTATPVPTATPTPEPCNCVDSDADGVPDAWDLCPGTPPQTGTDSTGCPPIRRSP